MKHVISDSAKFEILNIKEDRQLKFILHNEKKLKDIIKPFYEKDSFNKSKYDKIYSTGS